MGYSEPKLLAMGDAAWTVELGPDIDIDVNARCMGLAASIADAVASGELSGVVDIVPTFRSVTVHFDPRHSSAPTIPSHCRRWHAQPPHQQRPGGRGGYRRALTASMPLICRRWPIGTT